MSSLEKLSSWVHRVHTFWTRVVWELDTDLDMLLLIGLYVLESCRTVDPHVATPNLRYVDLTTLKRVDQALEVLATISITAQLFIGAVGLLA
jgi:hypothetical protein